MKTSVSETTTNRQRAVAIRAGRDYLRDHGWIREEYCGYDDGVPDFSVCDVVGAIAAANGWVDVTTDEVVVRTDLLLDVLMELNIDLDDRFDDITVLNDAAVDKQQVLDQMDMTIRRLDSGPAVGFSDPV